MKQMNATDWHHFELLEARWTLGSEGIGGSAWRVLGAAEAISIRTRRRYGVRAVCRAWRIPASSFYRNLRKQSASDAVPVAQVPPEILDDGQAIQQIRQIINASPFPAERHRKVWARLNRAGVPLGRETVRRLMREHGLGMPLFGSLIPDAPNVLWGIDSIEVPTGEDGMLKVLFVVDHYHLRWLAASVVKDESPEAWWSVLRNAVSEVSPGKPPSKRIKVCLDNLKAYGKHDLPAMMRSLRLTPHHISPGRPQSNGVAERFVRIVKENLLFWSRWDTLSDAQTAVEDFRRTYNREYLIERLGMRAPDDLLRAA